MDSPIPLGSKHGLNVPGIRLDEARRAYCEETDAQRKRAADRH